MKKLIAKACFKLLFLVSIVTVSLLPNVVYAETQSNDELLGDLAEQYNSNQNLPYSPSETSSVFSIDILSFDKNIAIGEKFACIVSYSASNDADDTVVTIKIPNTLRSVDFYDHNLNSVDYTLQTIGNSLYYSFDIGDIGANTVGNIVAALKYADTDKIDSQSQTISSYIKSSNINTTYSKDLILGSIKQEANWAMVGFKETTDESLLLDNEISYGISLYGNSEEVDMDMNDVRLTFDYPKNATVVDSCEGTVDESSSTIYWDVPVLFVGEFLEKNVVLKYSSQYFSSSQVDIDISASGKLGGTNDTSTIYAYIQHGLEKNQSDDTVVIGTPENYKALDNTEYTTGETSVFTIYGVENTYNTSFDNMEIIYEVPQKTSLVSIRTGQYNRDVGVAVYYKYKNEMDWNLWDQSTYTVNKELLTSSVSNSSNIEYVKWVITKGSQDISNGFSANNSIQVKSTVNGAYGDIFDVSADIQATLASNNEVVETICKDEYKVFPVLPDNLSEKRKKVIEAAYSLVGKVEYFWCGKSTVVGWDDQWGVMTKNDYIGTTEPYGLDCSGYTQWVYINSDFAKSYVISNFGNGTKYQYPTSQEISMSEVLPGDLSFKQTPSDSGVNHVGIFVGKDNSGNHLIAHCSGSYNNVVVTKYGWPFYYPRRPNIMMAYPT